MADIIDYEEIDRDIVEPEVLEQQFSKNYNLIAEYAVSLKDSYINKLHCTKSLKIAVSLQNNNIEVYEVNNTSLSPVCRLIGHQKTVTEVVFSPNEDHLLYTSGYDGLLKLWDIRTGGTCVQEYKDEEEELVKPYECMDVSCCGRVVCAGSALVLEEAYLVFWDRRATKPLGGYWNSHTDDITQVKFHPEKTEILATGASDSLLNVFDILQASEDDALTYSLNVGNSVERLSWLGSTLGCVTQAGDVQLWDAALGDQLAALDRDKIARGIRRSKGEDSYAVDVVRAADGPLLVAGSHAGHGEVLRSVKISGKKLQPSTNFSQNKQVVRCCWYCPQRELLITAGERGLVDLWGPGGDT